jgi:hypothetical protein
MRERVRAQLSLDRVEQGLELDGSLPRGGELARIEVQIDAQDLVSLRPEGRELPEPLLVGHHRILSN